MNELPPAVDSMPEVPPTPQPEPTLQELRGVFRALQNGEVVERETLVTLGQKLDEYAERTTDEQGNEVVTYKGPELRDEQNNPVLDEQGNPQHQNIPQIYAKLIRNAANAAAQPTTDQSDWAKAALADDLQNVSFSQAKSFVRSLNEGQVVERAFEAALAAPAEVQTNAEANAEKTEESEAEQNQNSVAINDVLAGIKNAPTSEKSRAALDKLNDKEKRILVARLADELGDEVDVASANDPQKLATLAKTIDTRLGKYASRFAPANVRKLYVDAALKLVERLGTDGQIILQQSTNPALRAYRSHNIEHVGSTGRSERAERILQLRRVGAVATAGANARNS